LQVALLFLTRLGIPYEAVWKAFLESVPDFGGQGSDSWMLLFNVYVHPPPNVVLHESSIFRNYQLPQRVAVEWGQWSVVRLTLPPCMTVLVQSPCGLHVHYLVAATAQALLACLHPQYRL
jgi:hypothetical protein